MSFTSSTLKLFCANGAYLVAGVGKDNGASDYELTIELEGNDTEIGLTIDTFDTEGNAVSMAVHIKRESIGMISDYLSLLLRS